MLFSVDSTSVKVLHEFANEDNLPIKYLAIDPGKANGICGYDAELKLRMMWTVREQDILTFLRQFEKIDKCIIENFLLYSNKAYEQVHSDMLTSRVIGRVENWAELGDIELIKQNASVKPLGYKYLGTKPLPKSNKLNHAMDAHAHFVYWGVRTRRINAADLLNNATPENIT
jgi:hypothetical protein